MTGQLTTNIFQCFVVEEETSDLSKSSLWFDQRSGSISIPGGSKGKQTFILDQKDLLFTFSVLH